MIAEILNVTHMYLVYEYENVLRTLVVTRDLEFLRHIFDKLRDFYFRHLVPYNLFGPIYSRNDDTKMRTEYLSDVAYDRLLKLIIKNQSVIGNKRYLSFITYHSHFPTSTDQNNFFTLNNSPQLLHKMNTHVLSRCYISEIEIQEMMKNSSNRHCFNGNSF